MAVRLSPDGIRYLQTRRPAPFHARALLPYLCRGEEWRWRAASISGAVLAAVSTGLLADNYKVGLAAAVMLLALPSTRFNLACPVLVDLPAMGLAAFAAYLYPHSHVAALVVVMVAGSIRETAPVFAALYAWTPLLLVGMVVPALLHFLIPRGPDCLDEHNAWILAHPVKASWEYHKHQYLDGMFMVLPWGGAIVGLAALDLQLGVLLAVAYAQMLVATDTVRLYQWAAPVMCVAACGVVPAAWLPVLVVLTVWNPFRGNGV